ncbi:MAG: GntR family transcriptional regulator [Dehalococcoidales bacterium]|nr:GntR family transcriptional regulator [Dehalococcoidales bacterium]
MQVVESDTKSKLAEEALIKIQQSIISGDLRPNQRLIEAELSQKLGMSRTPVREAIRRLQQTGYVTIMHNGGAIVTEFSRKNIKDQFEIREALETLVVRLGCELCTEEQISQARKYLESAAEAAGKHDLSKYNQFNALFHNVLLEACGNDRLISLVRTIRDYYYLGKLASIITEAELRSIIKQHFALLEAMSKRDKKVAVKSTRKILRILAKISVTRM